MDLIQYKRACLNCLYNSGISHTYTLQGFYDKILSQSTHPASMEFYAIMKLKSELYNVKEECEECNHTGAFDIWDLKVNEQLLSMSPPENIAQTLILINKVKGISDIDYKPTNRINNLTTLSQLLVIKQVINSIPSNQFIKHEHGQVIMVSYMDNNNKSVPNMLRYSGFSIKEIKDALDAIETKFRRITGLES
jgi:hypothetical protein